MIVHNKFLDSGYIERKKEQTKEENQISSVVRNYLARKEQISKFILANNEKAFLSTPGEKENLDDLIDEAYSVKKNVDSLISEKKIIKITKYFFDEYNCWRVKKYIINQHVFTKYDRFFRSYKPIFSSNDVTLYKLLHHKKFKVLKIFHSINVQKEVIIKNKILYNCLAEQGSMSLFMKYKGEESSIHISKYYNRDLFHLLSEKTLTPQRKLFYVKQILSTLLYMQKINFLHGDLKPENFFIDQTNNDSLVVGDLDDGVFLGKNPDEIKKTAQEIYNRQIRISTTNGYFSPHIDRTLAKKILAPDILLRCCHNFDIYSGGVIITEILIGRILDSDEGWPDLIPHVNLLELSDGQKFNLLLLIHTMTKDSLNCDLEKQITCFDPSIVEEVSRLKK